MADQDLRSREAFEAETKGMTGHSTVAEIDASGGTAQEIEVDVTITSRSRQCGTQGPEMGTGLEAQPVGEAPYFLSKDSWQLFNRVFLL